MDISDDMGVSKLSAKVFLKSELLLQCKVFLEEHMTTAHCLMTEREGFMQQYFD